jgi:asparagine synthase (glutamine-hydrolysing)
MCGVVGGLLAGRRSLETLPALAALRHRGPDAEGYWAGSRFWLGHTRLAILDTSAASEQPYRYRDVVLTFNGEVWNYRELRDELSALGYLFRTTGDTEVLAAALHAWDERALQHVQGMFAIAWTRDGGETIKLARDRFGETPLHVFRGAGYFAFASELKGLLALGVNPRGISWVEPGEVLRVDREGSATRSRWYELPGLAEHYDAIAETDARALVRGGIAEGSEERTVSDVPVCTLLSGGIDSAAIALHLAPRVPGLVAYTATLEGAPSVDLPAARATAERLGLELRVVTVPRPTAADLEGVVRTIETSSKAQVEIGWACLHLAREMRADGFRVTYSGEGSDELWAAYGLSEHGIRSKGWHPFRRALFEGQHRKNFARCNKVFMAHGVECRLPFLNTRLVETALALPQRAVRGVPEETGIRWHNERCWKRILREAYRGDLPDSVIARKKLPFQDGMGKDGGLQGACAAAVHDPARYYRAVLRGAFGEVET